MRNMMDNDTINYYDENAEQYFKKTIDVDMTENCDRFIKHVIPGGKIIDIGAGSGRDILYFKSKGFRVEGIDASVELCRLAVAYTSMNVKCQRIQEWNSTELYDAIWANALLLHLTLEEIKRFFFKAESYLTDFGVMYASFKSGIPTGKDMEGRYFTNVTREKVQKIVAESTTLDIVEIWETEDRLKRQGFGWINVILQKC